jgi:hypothetical protein
LRASKEDDPVWLLKQRAAEMTHIEKWLTEFYTGNKVPSERIWSCGLFGIILLVLLYLMGDLIYNHWCRLFDVNWKLSVVSPKHSLAV